MHRQQRGFTLIELVIVIVILGALAVVALPRFIDLSDEAEEAAVEGVAGALASGSAVNYAGALAGDGSALTVSECGHVAGTLTEGTLPTGYSFDDDTKSLGSASGDSDTCEVGNGTVSETFTAIYVTP